uniref:Putative group i salivary lipocalin n=1 Tax=Rhipicephalus pulchellus TaxID=72859 RepID=L7LT78_RHIPC
MRAHALFLVFALFVDVHGAPLKELIDALNTSKTIWLYKQSYPDSPEATGRTCVRWHKHDLTNSSYVFENYFEQGGEYHSENNTRATLSEMEGAGVMGVNYTREGLPSTHVYYTLDSWYPEEKCFILTRNINNRYACDLYLWLENVKRVGHETCDARYKQICGEGPTVFTDECW